MKSPLDRETTPEYVLKVDGRYRPLGHSHAHGDRHRRQRQHACLQPHLLLRRCLREHDSRRDGRHNDGGRRRLGRRRHAVLRHHRRQQRQRVEGGETRDDGRRRGGDRPRLYASVHGHRPLDYTPILSCKVTRVKCQ